MFVMIVLVIIMLVVFAFISGLIRGSVLSKNEEREMYRAGVGMASEILYKDSSTFLLENEYNKISCDHFSVAISSAIRGGAYFKREGENLILCLGNRSCETLDKKIINASELQIFLTNFQQVIRINGVEKDIIVVLNENNNNDKDSVEFMFTLCAISEGCILDYKKWISGVTSSVKNRKYFEENEILKEFLEKEEEYIANPRHKMELLWEVFGGEKYNC